MKYETIEAAIAENLNGTIYITWTIEAPCGPCYLGVDHEPLAFYSTEKEALDEVEDLYAEHRCEDEHYMLDVVKAEVDAEGKISVDDDEPIRSLPDDQYWDDHWDEWNEEYECWIGMEPTDDEEESEE